MLLALAAVPVVISAVLGLMAPVVGRRLPPAVAVKFLTPAALAAALTTGFCLAVLAFNALSQLPVVAHLGHWALAGDPDDGTPSPVTGVILAIVVVGLLITAVHYLVNAAADAIRFGSACRQLNQSRRRLVVLDDSVADAFAVPGRRRRIVITSAMLAALNADERAVLIAHERSHLEHHHQLFVQAANLAAQANPLLLGVAAVVRTLTERWADEDAAVAVEDRNLVARTVAKAALARTASISATRARVMAASGIATTGVPERVRALTHPQPRPQRRLAVALAGLAVAGLLASVSIAHATERKFEHAQRADSVSMIDSHREFDGH
ncbi:MAG: M56 family metallopeptidase [Microlunatus sp.]|nr:M56 family metallopeptidase [Microlunatus sp.]